MDRIALKAEEREVLGKKVKNLRRQGKIPGHVFGKKVETEHVAVSLSEFLRVFQQAGETGLINLRIGDSKVRPVLIRDLQVDPVLGTPIHIDFYQVNLSEKVKVPVPVVVIGEEPEIVHTGEAVVIQPVGELEVEALPADLPEKIEVDITGLKAIDDAVTVAQLTLPEGIEIQVDPETVVVKLDSAVSAEAAELMEEMEAEAEAAEVAEGEAPAEGETAEGEAASEGEETTTTEGSNSAEEKSE